MKFQKIYIENFACYYGKMPLINLDTKSDKPIIIFVGGTGFGKTSLFDAVNWALYGEEYEKDLLQNKDRDILDYVNEIALKEALINEEKVNMSVTLHFEHNLRQFYIKQTLTAKPEQEKNRIKAIQTERITNLREILPSGDHETINYNKIFLDEILPNNVKGYFLFDGDRIHNLAKPGNSQEVQDAIYRVVDLEIIRNAGDHLHDISLEYSQKASKAAKGELAKIEEEYQKELEDQKKIKKRLSDIKSERQAIKAQMDILDEKLKNLPETSRFQERRKQIQNELIRFENEKKELKLLLREDSSKASLGLAGSSIRELKNLLEEKRRKGEIPKHIQETLFQDIFDMGECICGGTFKVQEGDPIYDRLIERSKIEQKRSKEDDRLITLTYQLKETEKEIQESQKLLNEREDQLLVIEENERSLILEKQQVDKELFQLPQEDVNVLVNQRKEREEKDKILLSEYKDQEEVIKKSSEKLKELEKLIKEVGKQQKEAQALQFRSELSKKAGESIDALYEEFAEESRNAVEKLTISEFQKFVLSSSGYHVALSKDYELVVLDSNGNRALQRLSMGQSQCLSLAFITAISRVSEKQPPLVIDMPFSRLDPNVHEAISKRLPELSEQTILFLIPEVEWNNRTEKNLRHHASYIYQMEFDESKRQTTIELIN